MSTTDDPWLARARAFIEMERHVAGQPVDLVCADCEGAEPAPFELICPHWLSSAIRAECARELRAQADRMLWMDDARILRERADAIERGEEPGR